MTDLSAAYARLRAHALSLPDTTEEFPWGDRVIKVRGKVFVFMGVATEVENRLGLSVKLPTSGEKALESGFGTPTGYGLGKSGWVSLRYEGGDTVPVAQLEAWILESYEAVASKAPRAARARKPKA